MWLMYQNHEMCIAYQVTFSCNYMFDFCVYMICCLSSHAFYTLIPLRSIDLKITIRDGNFTDIEGLDPTITWENSALLSNDVALQVS